MSSSSGSYWSATRHPWACILFVLPLLVVYEVGLYLLGPMQPEYLRNGADVWLRAALDAGGFSSAWGAPILLLAVLLAWGFIYRERQTDDHIGVWVGMTVESVIFAVALLGLSRAVWPFLHGVGQWLDGRALLDTSAATAQADPALEHIVRYLGAGLYEETLFRLLLFGGLLAIFRLAELPGLVDIVLAAVGSALLFAGAHNMGPGGEPFQSNVFLFRTMAGVFFAWVYYWRGFGIAVGAHAGYDVLVGVMMRWG